MPNSTPGPPSQTPEALAIPIAWWVERNSHVDNTEDSPQPVEHRPQGILHNCTRDREDMKADSSQEYGHQMQVRCTSYENVANS